ncbi:hypothetical protein OH809_27465 [Streptomyces sp. NBC_00873]|uniref:hypothetical protein n=1 Tax=unclassified Streptomyces TaxID=2593676 RepID=UPI00386FBBE4|nr:hypothetical protein OH809_27465 [Streptomyces sp. NBC_00873]WTA43966.1 hypothetical protein OH821_16215 [Streptomyces sp. NBC_00842]
MNVHRIYEDNNTSEIRRLAALSLGALVEPHRAPRRKPLVDRIIPEGSCAP